MVPVCCDDTMHSAQFIGPNGEKRFLPDGRVKGCCFLIEGHGPGIVLAEGYATAASSHEATGSTVAAAFNASNLPEVARALMARMVSGKLNSCSGPLVIAADNDENGTGQEYAIEAARAVGGLVAIPPEIGDWNDIHTRHGLQAVRAGIEAAVDPTNLPDRSNPQGTTGDNGGTGDTRDNGGTGDTGGGAETGQTRDYGGPAEDPSTPARADTPGTTGYTGEDAVSAGDSSAPPHRGHSGNIRG